MIWGEKGKRGKGEKGLFSNQLSAVWFFPFSLFAPALILVHTINGH
jgi:hypothetical protein